jgi:hypothetical protein
MKLIQLTQRTPKDVTYINVDLVEMLDRYGEGDWQLWQGGESHKICDADAQRILGIIKKAGEFLG